MENKREESLEDVHGRLYAAMLELLLNIKTPRLAIQNKFEILVKVLADLIKTEKGKTGLLDSLSGNYESVEQRCVLLEQEVIQLKERCDALQKITITLTDIIKKEVLKIEE